MEVLDFALTPVQSSNLAAVGYDSANQSLGVQFKNGAAWRYDGVDQGSYDKMMQAESIGSHFARVIRPNFTGVPVQLPTDGAEQP